MGILTAVAFAFLGGLILNLMPCVFPVLSMKAAALARHAEHPQAAKAQGLVFLAGVLVTFLILAGILIAARAGGEAVGWGFHLQSPPVVASLALLMLLVGLNLSGVFEVGMAAQGIGSKGPTEGLAGAFLTGALAVVVAAPCTAPFMAGAIGWAFTQPPAATLAVFAALGLGLGAPFALISFVPALFRRLPKPGKWMDVLRKVLAFPMYGAAAWLAWVFALQAGDMALPFLFAAAIAVAFAAWAWGHAQASERKLTPRLAAALAVLAAVPLLVVGSRMTAPPAAEAATAAAPSEALPAEPWSPERVAALRAEGRPIFVDFTAAWCVTCQVNKRTALAGGRVAEAFKAVNGVYLEADWTNRDDRIAKALAEHGRSGVPLYLVYGKTGEPQVLPQLLTEGMIVQALQKARG
jgi:thiol:disulfide interchange protein DsbD